MREEASLPLKFEAILGQLERTSHDLRNVLANSRSSGGQTYTGVIDEDIKAILSAHEVGHSVLDTLEILQV